ncbi:MAG: outer membrane lipoprotein chaperone LolA [candidate division KSB1 bacterium]|nr:outer membrane lipoprotein chaperone LolA [candidate division KSB1 bacterium]
MRKIKQIAIIMFLMLSIQPMILAMASDDRAEDIIKKAKNKYDKIKTLKADFVQTFHWKLADNIHQQKGTVWLKGKDQFKIQTADQVVVCNGRTLWTYSDFNKQVIIDHVDKSREVTLPRDIFMVYSEQYRPYYVGVEKIDGEECSVLELVGKSEDQFIKQMKIWIHSKLLLPIKIEQLDLNNNENRYVLSNIELDIPLAANLFEYQPPAGVEVIDMR